MGTRYLTAVVDKNEYKVAQYGQCDGYPSSAGAFILKFLENPKMIARLRQNLVNVKFSAEHTDHSNRVIGCYILKDIAKSNKKEILLPNDLQFACDSLMCEWCYVIDLDTNSYEVYKGGNTQPIPAGERFASIGCTVIDEYYPVKLVHIFDINNLPEEKEFLSFLTS